MVGILAREFTISRKRSFSAANSGVSASSWTHSAFCFATHSRGLAPVTSSSQRFGSPCFLGAAALVAGAARRLAGAVAAPEPAGADTAAINSRTIAAFALGDGACMDCLLEPLSGLLDL